MGVLTGGVRYIRCNTGVMTNNWTPQSIRSRRRWLELVMWTVTFQPVAYNLSWRACARTPLLNTPLGVVFFFNGIISGKFLIDTISVFACGRANLKFSTENGITSSLYLVKVTRQNRTTRVFYRFTNTSQHSRYLMWSVQKTSDILSPSRDPRRSRVFKETSTMLPVYSRLRDRANNNR